MRLGILRQYEPRNIRFDRFPKNSLNQLDPSDLPTVDVVTPSFGQGRFLEKTLQSVLEQDYPKMTYRVKDGGSQDESVEILEKYSEKLAGWRSHSDDGQAAAINEGLKEGTGEIVYWVNSDDLVAPGAVSFAVDYFMNHPEVDAIYGHRILIDSDDREVARWVAPPHKYSELEWVDYVAQETLFMRRSLWERLGGLDESFEFAMDWDLLVRMMESGAKMVRLPYFLGCFRVHPDQKTSKWIDDLGAREMERLRQRVLGRLPSQKEIDFRKQNVRVAGMLCHRLLNMGIRI